MSSIRLLHASDLHIAFTGFLRSPLDQYKDKDLNPLDTGLITKLRQTVRSLRQGTMASSHDADTLEALAEFIYTNARKKMIGKEEVTEAGDDKLDGVILTGDLATTGHTLDIEKVSKFLNASPSRRVPFRVAGGVGGATLSAIRIPVIYLPGNHDRYMFTYDFDGPYPIIFKPAGTEFDRQLMDYVNNPVHSSDLMSDDHKLRVTIFCADFTLRKLGDHDGLLGWLAQGRVDDHVRNQLVAETLDAIRKKREEETLAVVWAIHFPPFYPGIKKHSRLLDEEVLVELANKIGVNAILAGHTHKQLHYGNPAMARHVLCCGTSTQYEPRALVGGPDEHNPLRGNLFQVLKISTNGSGEIRIVPRHFRYSALSHGPGPNRMYWIEVPS